MVAGFQKREEIYSFYFYPHKDLPLTINTVEEGASRLKCVFCYEATYY